LLGIEPFLLATSARNLATMPTALSWLHLKSVPVWKSYYRSTHTVVRRFSRVRTARFRKFAGVAPGIETHHSDLSVDGDIRIAGQLKQVFQSYRMMFNP